MERYYRLVIAPEEHRADAIALLRARLSTFVLISNDPRRTSRRRIQGATVRRDGVIANTTYLRCVVRRDLSATPYALRRRAPHVRRPRDGGAHDV